MRYKDEKKKEAIYRATILLLNREGFSNTSMSKIAKYAGVSASTIYIYFKNKDDMLRKLYLDTKQNISTKMFSNIEGRDAKANLGKIIRNYISYVISNKEAFFFLEQFINSPYIRKFSDQEADNYFSPMYELVRKGKEKGIIKNVSDGLLLAYIEPPITEFLKRYFRGEIALTDKNIETLINLAWDAIKK